ncbi:substrate-binding domain-containing protein [Streptomyces sp. NPDC001795]|uniref:substrate-binding domain-containing protein n=1 Tax=Streptomyces sp. NPDC001795 TaxID=3154525 RepID=UPI0033245151
MHSNRKTALRVVALGAVVALAIGCERGSSTRAGPSERPTTSGCPAAMARARTSVHQAEEPRTAWNGPTTGPKVVRGRSVIYVAQTMTNPGVAGTVQGAREAANTVGWKFDVIDGGGTPTGIQAALSQAIALKPSGIVLGGFDPKATSQQVAKANAENIPLIGWHAVDLPGPSKNPKLFANITTNVGDVARITADWIIAQSYGHAGVVIFTDASIPFAKNKSDLISKQLATCSGVRLLADENIPIPDASVLTPQKVSSLLYRLGSRWTYSAAINDLYFADAAPAFRAAGRKGAGPPHNIGAGDGDPSAFQRINSREYQAATVPEPLSQQGWQMIDEFNRAFAGAPASGYVAPVHVATDENTGGRTAWDPVGYREAYRKIWGV